VAEELEQAFELLATEPRIGAVARNSKLEAVRRVHLSRIRYHLYYRVRERQETVEVLAFWHSSRGSEPLS
jgi:plasmid stabilization system protein ParE